MISMAGSISNDSLRKKSRVQRGKVLLKSHHFFDKVREEKKNNGAGNTSAVTVALCRHREASGINLVQL